MKYILNPKLLLKSIFQQKYIMILHLAVLLLMTTVPAMITSFGGELSPYTQSHLIDMRNENIASVLGFKSLIMVVIIPAVSFISSYISFSYLNKKCASVFFASIPVKKSCMFITKFLASVIVVLLPLVVCASVNAVFMSVFDVWLYADGFVTGICYTAMQYILFVAVSCLGASISGNVFAQIISVSFMYWVYPVTYLIILCCTGIGFMTWSVEIFPDIGYMFPVLCTMLTKIPAESFVFSGALILLAVAAGLLAYVRRKTENAGNFYVFRVINSGLKYYISVCAAFLAWFIAVLITSVGGGRPGVGAMVCGVVFGVVTFVVLRGIFEKSFKAMFSKPLWILFATAVMAFFVSVPAYDTLYIDRGSGNLSSAEIVPFGSGMDFYSNPLFRHSYSGTITLTSPESLDVVEKMIEAGAVDTREYFLSDDVDYYNENPLFTVYPNNNILGLFREVYIPEDEYARLCAELFDTQGYRDAFADYIQKKIEASDGPLYFRLPLRDGRGYCPRGQLDDLAMVLTEDVKSCDIGSVGSSSVYAVVVTSGGDFIDVYSCYENTVEYIDRYFVHEAPALTPVALGKNDDFSDSVTITDEADIAAIFENTSIERNLFAPSTEVFYSVSQDGQVVGEIAESQLPPSVREILK